MGFRLMAVAIGYLFGLFQTGFIISNYVLHDDLRQKGSGNSGATNALRVFGVRVGVLVLIGDVLKCVICCLIFKFALKGLLGDQNELMMFYAALGVILGHCYPFYMKFKGGKGVSSFGGMVMVYDLRVMAILLSLFIILVAWKRFVSLGSICAVSGFLIMVTLFHFLGWHAFPAGQFPEIFVLSLIMVGLIVFGHRANIQRLLNGTENPLKVGHKE